MRLHRRRRGGRGGRVKFLKTFDTQTPQCFSVLFCFFLLKLRGRKCASRFRPNDLSHFWTHLFPVVDARGDTLTHELQTKSDKNVCREKRDRKTERLSRDSRVRQDADPQVLARRRRSEITVPAGPAGPAPAPLHHSPAPQAPRHYEAFPDPHGSRQTTFRRVLLRLRTAGGDVPARAGWRTGGDTQRSGVCGSCCGTRCVCMYVCVGGCVFVCVAYRSSSGGWPVFASCSGDPPP